MPNVWFVCEVMPLCEAVIVEAFKPKLTPLLLEKVTAAREAELPPAEKLMLALAAFTLTVAPLAPVVCDSVILLPPANTTVPVEMTMLAPAVFPAKLAFILPPFTDGVYAIM